jgi:CRP-like cAMP-binding protein
VVAERMRAGAIEETRVPRNPLDLLAQQIVAITADEEISVDELHDLVRRAYPFRDLSRKQLENVPALRGLLHRHANAMFNEAAQTVICNRYHSFEERCARWLLMTDDCSGGKAFGLTHEFLSYMLATRRASVSIAAAQLQRDGLIEYSRGVVRIVDRAGLEAASCECYQLTRSFHDEVFA